MARSQKAYVGSLPEFEIKPYETKYRCGKVTHHLGYVTVKCTRGGCKQTHVVKVKAWVGSSDAVGRPCPYCFKTSRLPESAL